MTTMNRNAAVHKSKKKMVAAVPRTQQEAKAQIQALIKKNAQALKSLA